MQDAVRRMDFTPGDVRFWVHGTIERLDAPDGQALTLVSSGSGQRFLIQPDADAEGRATVDVLRNARGAVTAWGRVAQPEGRLDIILRVEGHEATPRP